MEQLKSSTTLISVIIALYNAEDFIAETLNSVLNQTHKNLEIIIINDCSTDNSKQIVLSHNDPRIVYLENAANMGECYTRNYGIKQVTGEFIAVLDADDLAHLDRFAKQLTQMQNNPELGVCGCYAQYIGAKTGEWKYPVTNTEIKCRLLWGSAIVHSSAFIRTSVVCEHGIIYDKNYRTAGDYKYWVEISKHAQLHNIPEVLIQYRIHPKQLTATHTANMQVNSASIVMQQLTSLGIAFMQDDNEIMTKFLSYNFNLSLAQLQRLCGIYTQVITLNNNLKTYNTTLLNTEIAKRIYEAIYFSTSVKGLKKIVVLKNNFGLQHYTTKQRAKLYLKSLLKNS
jgi:glycosyltransferase involved in cell wall biosynthesis